MSFNSTIKNGMLWTVLGRYVNQVITLGLAIIMARLLTPEDYGLIGMIAIFVSIGDVLTNSGLTLAIIQREEVNEEDYNTVFWTNLLLAFLAFSLLFFSAPFIADFYNETRLVSLIKAYAFVFIIGALSLLQIAQLRRNLELKKVELADILSTLVGGIMGMTFAYKGFSYWSIVIQQISFRAMRLLLLYYYNRWLPQFSFSISSIKSLASYSLSALGIKLIRIAVNKLDLSIIGKVANPVVTGLYSRGQFLVTMPNNILVKALQKAAFPVLSKLQKDEVQFSIVYRKMILTSIFVIYPILFLLWNYGSYIIQILLGEKWLGVVPYLKLYCFVVIFYPNIQLSIEVLLAKGFAYKSLKVELFLKAILLIMMLVGVFIGGVQGLIIGIIIANFISFAFAVYLIAHHANYDIQDQLLDWLKINIPFFATVAVILLMKVFLIIHPILSVLIFLTIFLIISFLTRNEIFQFFKGLVKERLPIRS